MRTKKSESGFLLLEVLMAISILSLGATASVRVISEASYISRQLQERDLIQQAEETLAFKIYAGEFPELFDVKGGSTAGTLEVTDSISYIYEIESTPYQQSKTDFDMNITLSLPEGSEISSTPFFVRREGA